VAVTAICNAPCCFLAEREPARNGYFSVQNILSEQNIQIGAQFKGSHLRRNGPINVAPTVTLDVGDGYTNAEYFI
jgi:hypothetical protein